jgi:hypothetical protein
VAAAVVVAVDGGGGGGSAARVGWGQCGGRATVSGAVGGGGWVVATYSFNTVCHLFVSLFVSADTDFVCHRLCHR